MTDEKLDLLLRQALNLEIADHDIQIDAAKIKSDRNTTSWKYWKHFPAAAASVAVLTLSSMMVCAAWHYLSAKDVAGKAADPHLAQEFEQNNWIDGCETQICPKMIQEISMAIKLMWQWQSPIQIVVLCQIL